MTQGYTETWVRRELARDLRLDQGDWVVAGIAVSGDEADPWDRAEDAMRTQWLIGRQLHVMAMLANVCDATRGSKVWRRIRKNLRSDAPRGGPPEVQPMGQGWDWALAAWRRHLEEVEIGIRELAKAIGIEAQVEDALPRAHRSAADVDRDTLQDALAAATETTAEALVVVARRFDDLKIEFSAE